MNSKIIRFERNVTESNCWNYIICTVSFYLYIMSFNINHIYIHFHYKCKMLSLFKLCSNIIYIIYNYIIYIYYLSTC